MVSGLAHQNKELKESCNQQLLSVIAVNSTRASLSSFWQQNIKGLLVLIRSVVHK